MALIETVILAPLYLYILAGVLYVAGIQFAQAKAQVAGRYAAWTTGVQTQSGPTGDQVRRDFFWNVSGRVEPIEEDTYESGLQLTEEQVSLILSRRSDAQALGQVPDSLVTTVTYLLNQCYDAGPHPWMGHRLGKVPYTYLPRVTMSGMLPTLTGGVAYVAEGSQAGSRTGEGLYTRRTGRIQTEGTWSRWKNVFFEPGGVREKIERMRPKAGTPQ